MSSIMISEIMERHIKSICSEYGTYIVNKLSTKYGFDNEDAIRELEIPSIKRAEAAAPRRRKEVNVTEKKAKEDKVEKVPAPSIPLPFCGIIVEGWCRAITKNNKLYTQCTNAISKTEGLLCKKCAKIVEKDGELPFGLITSRTECDPMSFKDPKGNSPILYSIVMAKVKITREEAESEAAKFGFTIPEEQFVVIEKTLGRPKKNAAAENSDDESSSSAEKKARGRPKKEKPVKASSKIGDDIIAGLLQQAKANGEMTDDEDDDSSQKSNDSEPAAAVVAVAEKPNKVAKKTKQTEEEKAAVKAAKEVEKAAEKASKLAAKEAEKAAKEAEKEAAKAAEKATKKEAEKAAKVNKKAEKTLPNKAAKAPVNEEHDEVHAEEYSSSSVEDEDHAIALAAVTVETKTSSGGIDESKEESDKENESEEEEAVTVKKFDHAGKKYKISTDNVLYDWDTNEPVGLWNPKTKKIENIPDDSSDEEDDDE